MRHYVHLISIALLSLFLSACRTTEEMMRQVSPELLEGPAGQSLKKAISDDITSRERVHFLLGALLVLGIIFLISEPRRLKKRPGGKSKAK